MVTAELAVALPALAIVVGAAFGGVSAMTAQLRCADAAAAASRLAARGESDGAVRAAAQAAEPGATVSISRSTMTVKVVVAKRLAGPGALHGLGVTVRQVSVAPLEPTGDWLG
jgi:Flp pilus assembly protein TadG